MGKYCANCGNQMRDGALYCGKCGASAAGTPPPQQNYAPSGQKIYSASNTPPKSAARRRGGSHVLCVVLSIVLLLQIVAVALYGWPGFAVKSGANKGEPGRETAIRETDGVIGFSDIRLKSNDYKAKPFTIDVGPENTIAKSNGIVVDFGAFNLSEDETLHIKDLGIKTDEKYGISAHCYDFHIEDTEEFPTLVSITLPYEQMENAADRLFVQYYHEDSNTWELLYSELNEADNTITFYTDHFSTYALFDYFEYTAGYNSGPLAKVAFNSAKLEKALNSASADAEIFFRMLKKNSAEDSGLIDVALDSLNLSGYIVSASDNTVKLISTSGFVSQELSKTLGKKLGKIGAGMVAIKVGLSWYESGNVTDALKAHRYDLAELGLGVVGSSLGLTPFTIAAAGIWILGMADQEVTNVYNQGYDGPIEHAYQYFTWEYVSYSNYSRSFGCTLPSKMPARAYFDDMKDAEIVSKGHVWARLLKQAFLKHRNEPVKIFQAFDKLVDDYTSVFWKLKPGVRKLIAEDIHRADAWEEPSAAEIAKQKEKLKGITNYRLRKLYACLYDRCILDAKQRLLWEMADLQEQLNTVTEFSVFVSDENGKELPLSKTKYKEYIAAFAASPQDKPTIWSWMPGREDKSTFQCTLYNYLAMDSPSCVKFYPTWEDQVNDKAAFSLPFTYDQPSVKLTLENAGIDAKWFTGGWNTVRSDNTDSGNAEFDLFIEILDGTNCTYRFNYGGRPTTKYQTTTYVFDPVKRTLEMDTLDVGNLVLTAYDKDEGAYGKDFIRANFGERYVRVK
jgi:hypothetical protein